MENITIEKRYVNGEHTQYEVRPDEGYVLHDKLLDFTEGDALMGDEQHFKGYYSNMRTVGLNYDFTENPREFYAVLKSEVPEKQIF